MLAAPKSLRPILASLALSLLAATNATAQMVIICPQCDIADEAKKHPGVWVLLESSNYAGKIQHRKSGLICQSHPQGYILKRIAASGNDEALCQYDKSGVNYASFAVTVKRANGQSAKAITEKELASLLKLGVKPIAPGSSAEFLRCDAYENTFRAALKLYSEGRILTVVAGDFAYTLQVFGQGTSPQAAANALPEATKAARYFLIQSVDCTPL